MAVSVVMPALEMAQETGKLVSWLKKEGEQVRRGEMLLEVETDKAVVEVEAAQDGILAGVTAQIGDVVPVGHTIAWLVQPGEAVPASPASQVQTGRRTTEQPAAAAAPRIEQPSTPAASPRISPKARKLASERGVDIRLIKGSGPGGEILADDILKAPAGPKDPPYGILSAGPKDPPHGSTAERLMAERTTQSWTTAPHFFVSRDVDATALNASRAAQLPSIEKSHGVKLTHTDLLVASVARALRKHPRVNGSWDAGRIRMNDDINIALAMAVENAVVTAVIPHADRMPLGEIAARRRELADRASANRLQPSDIGGATFTISNLGMFGVDSFTAIIVPPQAAILAVGAIADRVVAVNGAPAVRPMMTLTLSSDHRILDGARAAAFLNDVVAELEQPA
jgi:pyruvate dehydrogenase E2 component (dihydrolipoamide acetyltransferase)